MSAHFVSILLALTCLTPILTHATDRPETFVTDRVTLGCGYADPVFEYILNTMEKHSADPYALRGEQGEDGRRLYIYDDGSWFLTFEYLSPVGLSFDISCIVAKGDVSLQQKALMFRATELPKADIGASVQRPDLR